MQTILENTQTKLFLTVVSSIFFSFFTTFAFYNFSITLFLLCQVLTQIGAKTYYNQFNGILYKNFIECQNLKEKNIDFQDKINKFIISKLKQDEESSFIILTSQFFGIILFFSLRTLIVENDQILKFFAFYIITNIIFHVGEFMLVSFYHYDQLCWKSKSFMINHSLSYNIAFVFSQIEFWTKYYWQYSISTQFTGLKLNSPCFTQIWHILRIGAFLNAKHNFQHLVQYMKQKNHVLVKNGLYSIVRHPSYLGFFLYSLGGQLILQNYICFVAYFVVLWRFFYGRIFEEEFYLVKFFGQEYLDYREKTGVYIPGVDFFLKRKRKYYFNLYKKQM